MDCRNSPAASGALSGSNSLICQAPTEPRDEHSTEFVLRRNCSIGPLPLLVVFASLVALSFGFGAAFAAHGPWMILPFAGLEMLALGAAFAICGGRAGEYERVTVSRDAVTVENVTARTREVHEFNTQWAQLDVTRAPQAVRIFLAQSGRRLELGRHLGFERRLAFAAELRAALASARA